MSGTDVGAAFLTALVVWLAALITPGPDFAATVHASVGGSRRSGLGVAAGVSVGIAAWATASLFGLHPVPCSWASARGWPPSRSSRSLPLGRQLTP